MDFTTVLTGFFTFAATAFGAWLTYRLKDSSTKKEFIEKLLDECQQLRDSLGHKDQLILELQTEVRILQTEVHQMRDQIATYESSRAPSDAPSLVEVIANAIPHPVWIHEVGQNKHYLSDAYSKMFFVGRKDFWTPVNIFRYFPPEVAAQFIQNDMAVIEANAPRCFKERFPTRIMEPEDNENPATLWDVVKIPVRAGGRNYVVGFCSNLSCEQTIVASFNAAPLE